MQKTACLAICVAAIGNFAPAHAEVTNTSSAIPYASPAAALADLRAKSGVVFSKEADWLIAKDTDGANWSFTTSSHPAHPSVGRRKLLERNGRFYVETQLMCHAAKPACDKLHGDYVELDRRMNEAIRKGNDAGRRANSGPLPQKATCTNNVQLISVQLPIKQRNINPPLGKIRDKERNVRPPKIPIRS